MTEHKIIIEVKQPLLPIMFTALVSIGVVIGFAEYILNK